MGNESVASNSTFFTAHTHLDLAESRSHLGSHTARRKATRPERGDDHLKPSGPRPKQRPSGIDVKVLDVIVESEPDTAPAPRDHPPVNVMIVTWAKHHTSSSYDGEKKEGPHCNCTFCSETRNFGRFMETRLGYNVEHVYIPDDESQAFMLKQVRLFFDRRVPTKEVAPLSILCYCGHGHLTEKGRFEWNYGKSKIISWAAIIKEFHKTVPGNALIIMNACHAGAAAVEAKLLQTTMRGPWPVGVTVKADNPRTIGLLAAGDWQSKNPEYGYTSFTFRLGRALDTLLRSGQELSMLNISALLAWGFANRVRDDAAAQGTYYPLTLPQAQFVLPYDGGFQARQQHDRRYKLLAGLGLTRNFVEPSQRVLVVILRLGRADMNGMRCGEMVFECDLDTTVKDILSSWKAKSCLTKVRNPDAYSLRCANHQLQPGDTMERVRRLKKEVFGNAKQAQDGVYSLHISNNWDEVGQVRDHVCFCDGHGQHFVDSEQRKMPVKVMTESDHKDMKPASKSVPARASLVKSLGLRRWKPY